MATLKISELSVGDWVMCNEDKYRVMGITMFHELDLLKSSESFRTTIDNIESIPITAEMLEENGFTRRSNEFPIYEYITLLGKMLRITVVSLNHPYSYIACRIEDTSKELHEPDRITVGSSVDRNPIHIHDLQHALRLAGLDKEINL